MPGRAVLYYHTLRHTRPWQVLGRIVAKARQSLGLTRLPDVPDNLGGRLVVHAQMPAHDPWNTREAVLNGRFKFLEQEAMLGRPVDWNPPVPLLWRFNLHYFHYLHLLAPEDRVALCREWVIANPPGTAVAWHPYPTSLRIVNWCRANLRDADLQRSLYRQAAWLYRNLETYVYGNHLLENARALVFAGCFFRGAGEAERWLDRGLALYRRETTEQVLSDGMHFERSPMYHALMLEGYVDVLNLLPADYPDRPWLTETVAHMASVLDTLTHPDGTLALFNDSTHEIALPPSVLRDYARAVAGEIPPAPAALPEAGYYVYRSPEAYLIADGGAVGPDYLMAHAHADVGSFELSIAGSRIVVDAGVFEYAAGPMRDYVRSTAAHNTVSIDGRDQVECWGSFRVARRAAPHGVRFRSEPGRCTFGASFDGYSELLGDGIGHTRRLELDEAERTLRVDDLVTGGGTHVVESRIHFHPEVVATVDSDGRYTLRRGDVACALEIEAGGLRWEEGWYCPRFGERHACRVAVIGGRMRLPATLRYVMHF